MATPDQIPEATVYTIVGSRAWTDLSAVHRIIAGLLARGADLRLGGCQAIQDAAMTVALSLLEASDLDLRCRAYRASGPDGNVIDRDRSLLDDLASRQAASGDAVLIAFLALDANGKRGRTHQLCRLAEERGIPVVVIPEGPAEEPTGSPVVIDRANRVLHHVDRAERAFGGHQFSRHALYTVAVSAGERLLTEFDVLEGRLTTQWAWLDANPLVVDFSVREHRTLNGLVTYTAIERVRQSVAGLIAQHAHEADYVPAFPAVAERSVRDAWAS